MGNSTNVNITVKITIYYIGIFYNPTPKPTHHSNFSEFLHFQSFCIQIYKLVSSWGPKKYSHKVNLLVLLYLWGHLVPIMGREGKWCVAKYGDPYSEFVLCI